MCVYYLARCSLGRTKTQVIMWTTVIICSCRLQPKGMMPEALPEPTAFCFRQVLLNPEHHIFPLPSSFHWRSFGKKTAGRPRAWGHGATHYHLPKRAGRDPHAHRDHTHFQQTKFQQLFISPALLLWSPFTACAGSFHLQFSTSFRRAQQTTRREDIAIASPALCSMWQGPILHSIWQFYTSVTNFREFPVPARG